VLLSGPCPNAVPACEHRPNGRGPVAGQRVGQVTDRSVGQGSGDVGERDDADQVVPVDGGQAWESPVGSAGRRRPARLPWSPPTR
jgi:hypothetical protein